VLLLDEAQNLSMSLLEEVRILADLEGHAQAAAGGADRAAGALERPCSSRTCAR
jgi:hypothetical protein